MRSGSSCSCSPCGFARTGCSAGRRPAGPEPMFQDFLFTYQSLIDAVGINGLLALSLYVVLALGQLSLGQAAFMGIGAYSSALLTTRLQLPFPLVLLAAACLPALAALLIGRPTARLSGVYLALATIGFGEVLRIFYVNAGQAQRPAGDFGIDVEDPQHFAEADGREGEIDAGKPRSRPADEQGSQRRQASGGEQDERERQLQPGRQQRRGIGADAHEGGLAERQLAQRQHDIEAERQQAVDPDGVDQALIGEEKILEHGLRPGGPTPGRTARPGEPTR